MKNGEIFEGFWYARTYEQRYCDEWDSVFSYEPDEWVIAFQPEGRYVEIYRPHGPSAGTWSVWNGIITTGFEGSEEIKCIFREEDGGTYLYYYNGFYRFSFDPEVIVKTYAHTRRRVERPDWFKRLF